MMSNPHDYREDLYNHHKAQITDIPDDSEDTLGEGCECWIQMPVAIDVAPPQVYSPITKERGSENDPENRPPDPLNPGHYRWLPSGVEVIDVTEWLPFNVGNVVKYCLRSDYKNAAIEDLMKARWYLDREIARRKKMDNDASPR